MSSSKKYYNYDKGRFRMPLSRKKKALVHKERQDQLKIARENIEKWINDLPSVGYSSDNNDGMNEYMDEEECKQYDEDDFDEPLNKRIKEVSGECQDLNTGFVLGVTSVASPSKCDLSISNLLPNRLRERKPSAVHTSTTSNNLEAAEVAVCLFSRIKESAGKTNLDNIDKAIAIGIDKVVYKNPMEMEVKFKCPESIDEEELKSLDSSAKMGKVLSTLNGLCLKVAKMDIQVNHNSDGIATRMVTLQTQMDQDSGNIARIIQENATLKGLVQCQFHQIRELNDKVAHLTAKSMENNITISSLKGDRLKEKCKESFIGFPKNKMEIDVDEDEVIVAHRVGRWDKHKKIPRLMIVHCKYKLKERTMTNVANLKDKKNKDGDAYYINKQLPEKLMEQNRAIRHKIKEIKEKESEVPAKDKSKIEVRQKALFVDGEQHKEELQPPEPFELFPDSTEMEKMAKMKLAS